MTKLTINTLSATREFEIVEKIPTGFFVWNIGANMGTDEYIPLCEDLHPEDKDDYNINPDTLKAIKLDTESVHKLRSAAGYGVIDRASAEKALKRQPKSIIAQRKYNLAAETIEIFKKIS